MYHRKSGRKLNRTPSHRKSMFRNMVVSLVYYEVIITSLFKAKELKRIIEPLITLAKNNNLSNRRLVFSRIRNNKTVIKLFHELGPRFSNYPEGGYTRIFKCGFRKGDNAPMAYIKILNKSKKPITSSDQKHNFE